MRIESAIIRGAQAASLQFAAACREHGAMSLQINASDFFRHPAAIRPASCRTVQAGSLRSPESERRASVEALRKNKKL
jgi:hypothetical protein